MEHDTATLRRQARPHHYKQRAQDRTKTLVAVLKTSYSTIRQSDALTLCSTSKATESCPREISHRGDSGIMVRHRRIRAGGSVPIPIIARHLAESDSKKLMHMRVDPNLHSTVQYSTQFPIDQQTGPTGQSTNRHKSGGKILP